MEAWLPIDASWTLAQGALVAVGLCAGVVNVFAGGGGLFAMPALVLLSHLGDTTANGTFRIAVLAQSIAATAGLYRSGHIEWRQSAPLLPPVLIGAVLGAWQAATLGDGGTRKLILGATLVATLLFVVGERRLVPASAHLAPASAARRVATAVLLVATGWYGGLIQAGVGFVLLVVLRGAARLSLPEANAQKIILVLCYSPLTLAAFASQERIDPGAGVALALGMAVGAWWAARWSVGPQSAGRIRWAVVAMTLLALARLALGD